MYVQGRRLRGDIGETVPSKIISGNGAAYIPLKFKKYLIKQISTVFPTVRTGSCVVCMVLIKLKYYNLSPTIEDLLSPKPRAKSLPMSVWYSSNC